MPDKRPFRTAFKSQFGSYFGTITTLHRVAGALINILNPKLVYGTQERHAQQFFGDTYLDHAADNLLRQLEGLTEGDPLPLNTLPLFLALEVMLNINVQWGIYKKRESPAIASRRIERIISSAEFQNDFKALTSKTSLEEIARKYFKETLTSTDTERPEDNRRNPRNSNGSQNPPQFVTLIYLAHTAKRRAPSEKTDVETIATDAASFGVVHFEFDGFNNSYQGTYFKAYGIKTDGEIVTGAHRTTDFLFMTQSRLAWRFKVYSNNSEDDDSANPDSETLFSYDGIALAKATLVLGSPTKRRYYVGTFHNLPGLSGTSRYVRDLHGSLALTYSQTRYLPEEMMAFRNGDLPPTPSEAFKILDRAGYFSELTATIIREGELGNRGREAALRGFRLAKELYSNH